MQIKLTESDIRAGIALYLASRGITGVNGGELQVTFTAGRKGSGLTAEVVTEPSEAKAVATKEKSTAALPTALGGTANTTNVEGAKEAAIELEQRREQAEEEAPVVETKAEAPVEEAPADQPIVEAKDEGGSLFN